MAGSLVTRSWGHAVCLGYIVFQIYYSYPVLEYLIGILGAGFAIWNGILIKRSNVFHIRVREFMNYESNFYNMISFTTID